MVDNIEYRIAAGHRYTPCNGRKYKDPHGKTKHCPGTRIRAKIPEPGVYVRLCDRCGNVYWFLLEESLIHGVTGGPVILLLRWITAADAAEWLAASNAAMDGPDLTDIV